MRQPEPPSAHVTRDNLKMDAMDGWRYHRYPTTVSFRLGTCPLRRTNTESLVFFEVDAKALGHAVEGSAVDAEDLSGLTSMMFGDFENVKEVAAF
jgi:hypothetical protein